MRFINSWDSKNNSGKIPRISQGCGMAMFRSVMDANGLLAGLRSRAGASDEKLTRLRAKDWISVVIEEKQMTKIEAQVPDYLARQAREVAERERLSIDQIVALALSAQLAVWKVSEDIPSRARRANLKEFDRVLGSVPDAPPLPGDELPPGYHRD
jgi:hypothetical protein